MKYILWISIVLLSCGCVKEYGAQDIATLCHSDTTKPIEIIFPGHNSTLRQGGSYEVTWHGAQKGITEYEVWLIHIEPNNVRRIKLGTLPAFYCTFPFTVPTTSIGSGWHIGFLVPSVFNVESGEFSIVQ